MVRRIISSVALLFGVGLGAASAQLIHPGLGEWGDAPEGTLAYPDLGVVGNFPTLFATAGAGYIWHGAFSDALLGVTPLDVDFETDGNGGFNLFPPYDRDECYGPADQDAGLHNPAAYTIDLGNNYVPCHQPNPMIPMLGNACGTTMPFAASIFDLWIVNQSGTECVINILIDWDQDGRWGGQSICPNGNIADEHAVVNLFVPDPYIGPIGGLGMPQIAIGPNSGYVWARFSIMNLAQAPPIGWDGSGEFDVGETEDYLLLVGNGADAEYGDAPEGALAYPNGVMGQFPTCASNPASGQVEHMAASTCFFGPGLDYEADGNTGDCVWSIYDRDECGVNDGDSGLLFPNAFTLANGVVSSCAPGARRGLGSGCQTAQWGSDIDIDVSNMSPDLRFVNVLADWDEDGQWQGNSACGALLVAEEHVLVDFPIPPGYSGPLSQLSPPNFLIGPASDGYVWMRFTISESGVGPNWDGNGIFGEGETEDYLLRVDPPVVDTELATPRGLIRDLRSYPNPFNPRTTIRFELATAGKLELRILDSRGRVLRQLHSAHAEAGPMEFVFDGRDDRGAVLPSGVYHAELRIGNEIQSQKLLMLK